MRLDHGSGRGNARGISGGLFAYRDGIFDVQIAGSLAQAAAHSFAFAAWCDQRRSSMALLRDVRDRSGQVELAIAAGVRARVDEVRARRRMQHDGLRCRRLRRLIAEREVDANRGETRGNCTRSSFAAMRLRRCFSRRRLRAPSGPTVVNFMCVASRRARVDNSARASRPKS